MARFAQINHKLERNKIMHEKFWKEIREDYNKLAHLAGVVDKYLAPLVTVSFVSNTFFICVQLYNSLKWVYWKLNERVEHFVLEFVWGLWKLPITFSHSGSSLLELQLWLFTAPGFMTRAENLCKFSIRFLQNTIAARFNIELTQKTKFKNYYFRSVVSLNKLTRLQLL